MRRGGRGGVCGGALGCRRGRETGGPAGSSSGGDTAAYVRGNVKHHTLEAWWVLGGSRTRSPGGLRFTGANRQHHCCQTAHGSWSMTVALSGGNPQLSTVSTSTYLPLSLLARSLSPGETRRAGEGGVFFFVFLLDFLFFIDGAQTGSSQV